MATSGRGIPDSILNTFVFDKEQTRILKDWKFNQTLPNAALAFPVTTNNFKDMIHSIHAGRLGGPATFMDARDRTPSAITLLDYRRKGFPGVLNNCETCHLGSTTADKTYNKVPANTLASTYESIDAAYAAAKAAGTATPAIAKAALSVVSDTDTVMTPYAAACFSCHNRDPATAHITSNGGVVKGTRDKARVAEESCTICHGPGKEADVVVIHK
jgi:OmcA/MtrC family decaheme c-type cytochrome